MAGAKTGGVMFIKPGPRVLLFVTLFLVGVSAIPAASALEKTLFAKYDAHLQAVAVSR